jgi:hypothetical protein
LSKTNRFGRRSTLGGDFPHDNLNVFLKICTLNNNQFSQNAISHKELSDFLIRARKDISSFDTPDKNKSKESQELIDLLEAWTESSKKLLLMISKEQKVLTENRSPKSLIAFGAMGAHINMALQALKATESDQEG